MHSVRYGVSRMLRRKAKETLFPDKELRQDNDDDLTSTARSKTSKPRKKRSWLLHPLPWLVAAVVIVMVVVTSFQRKKAIRKNTIEMQTTCESMQDRANLAVLMYVHSEREVAAAQAAASFFNHAACPKRVFVAVYFVGHPETFQREFFRALRFERPSVFQDSLWVLTVPGTHDAGRLEAFSLLLKRLASKHMFCMFMSDGVLARPRWDRDFLAILRAQNTGEISQTGVSKPVVLTQVLNERSQVLQFPSWTTDKYGMLTLSMRDFPKITLDAYHEAIGTQSSQTMATRARDDGDIRGLTGEAAILKRSLPQVLGITLKCGWVGGYTESFTKWMGFGVHVRALPPRYEATWLSYALFAADMKALSCLKPLVNVVPPQHVASRIPSKFRQRHDMTPAEMQSFLRQRRRELGQSLQELAKHHVRFTRHKYRDSSLLFPVNIQRRERMRAASLFMEAAVIKGILLGLIRSGLQAPDHITGVQATLFTDAAASMMSNRRWYQFIGVHVFRRKRLVPSKGLAKVKVYGRGRLGMMPGEPFRDIIAKYGSQVNYDFVKNQFQ